MKPKIYLAWMVSLLFLSMVSLWGIDISVSAMNINESFFGTPSGNVKLYGLILRDVDPVFAYHLSLILAMVSVVLMFLLAIYLLLEKPAGGVFNNMDAGSLKKPAGGA